MSKTLLALSLTMSLCLALQPCHSVSDCPSGSLCQELRTCDSAGLCVQSEERYCQTLTIRKHNTQGGNEEARLVDAQITIRSLPSKESMMRFESKKTNESFSMGLINKTFQIKKND